jgi:hypothetical protein
VSVNGEWIGCDGIRETLSIFFASFAAFNLEHPKKLEALIEFFESEVGCRRRITNQRARVLNYCK